MSFKSNQVLIGVIILLIGVFALFQNYFQLSYGNISLIIIGGAFLLLYRTKRKSWPLILGVPLAYIGVSGVLSRVFPFHNTAAMFFIIPSIIFLILYYDKNKQGLLLPGMVLLWFGIFLILKDFSFIKYLPFALLPVCIGAAFVIAYTIGRVFMNRWALYAGVVLLLVGSLSKLNLKPDVAFIQRVPAFLSAALICAGIFVIIRAVMKK